MLKVNLRIKLIFISLWEGNCFNEKPFRKITKDKFSEKFGCINFDEMGFVKPLKNACQNYRSCKIIA